MQSERCADSPDAGYCVRTIDAHSECEGRAQLTTRQRGDALFAAKIWTRRARTASVPTPTRSSSCAFGPRPEKRTMAPSGMAPITGSTRPPINPGLSTCEKRRLGER